MTNTEAAEILEGLADRLELSYLDVLEASTDPDAKALLRSSGDIEVVLAMRAGASLLREPAVAAPAARRLLLSGVDV